MAERNSRRRVFMLVTDCIRKHKLPSDAVTSLRHFPADQDGTLREHFIELDVIIYYHDCFYSTNSFSNGVRSLMLLRNYCNSRGNVFSVSSMTNEDKKTITQYYLKCCEKKRKLQNQPITNTLRKYIKEAAPVVNIFIQILINRHEVKQKMLLKLVHYVKWLQQL